MVEKPVPLKITKTQIRELLKIPGCRQDKELSSITGETAYQLPDGRVLLVIRFVNAGVVLESRSAVLSLFRKTKHQRSSHLLQGRLPQGKHFSAKVPGLLAALANKLDLSDEDLDMSLDSLEKVDRAVRRLYGLEARLDPEVFAPLVAYVGEVIRKETGGKWKMVLDKQGEVWEPWIVAPNGRQHPPFSLVYDELYEHSTEGSSRGAVIGEIRAHRLWREK